MYADVQTVSVLSHGKLAVTFQNGLQGTVQVMPSFYRGVFAHLVDPEEFGKVRVDNGYVTWPGELDIAPDSMYRAIADNGSFILQ